MITKDDENQKKSEDVPGVSASVGESDDEVGG